MTNKPPPVDILQGDILAYYHILEPSKIDASSKSFGLVLSKPVWKPGFTTLSDHLRLEIFSLKHQTKTTWIFYDCYQYRLNRLRNGASVQIIYGIIYGIDTKK